MVGIWGLTIRYLEKNIFHLNGFPGLQVNSNARSEVAIFLYSRIRLHTDLMSDEGHSTLSRGWIFFSNSFLSKGQRGLF